MEHKHTNRLIGETSPYLLQHAHNPVDWYPWGDEAFQKAKSENKPILLSIGYSACHWCHVMEHESFENEKIAGLMNELFLNIKVDREERPDLDEIYMSAVQMLTGRGGWPMTTFLTPEGKPFYGGTYFPPEDRGGMVGFPRILKGVAQAFRERSDDVAKSAAQIIGNLQRMSESPEATQQFSKDIVVRSAEQLGQAYDAENGGLGKAPKFPNAGVYEVFLRAHHQSKNERFLVMLVHTLEKMANGGIYDHLGGGFHRYSVDAKWLVPHFEKMLYDNAQLLRSYAHAYAVTKIPLFKQVVEETMGYLLREMKHGEGGFYSTQDADSEGVEGKFFIWSEREVNEILGAEDAAVFCRMYDVTEQGNFEGENILHPILTVEQASKYFGRPEQAIKSLVTEAKAKLFRAREKRIKPFRDEKIITAWNGLMLSGLAAAIRLDAKPEYLEAGNQIIDFFADKMMRDDFLLHTYKDGQAKLLGFLDDYAFFAMGLVDFYEASFERSALDYALQLTDVMVKEFWDSDGGGFFYTGTSHEELISRSKPFFDASVPSGNSLAAQLLLRLHALTGDERYRTHGEKVLQHFYSAMERQPYGLAHMVCAVDFYLQQATEIVVIGNLTDDTTERLIETIHSRYLPNAVLQVVEPNENFQSLSPLLRDKRQLAGKPTVYVCRNNTCSAPVTDVAALAKLLE